MKHSSFVENISCDYEEWSSASCLPCYEVNLFRSYYLKTQTSSDSIRKLSELYISIDSGHLLLSTFPQAYFLCVLKKQQHTKTHRGQNKDTPPWKTHFLRSINFGTTSARLSCLHLDLFYWLCWSPDNKYAN